MGALTVRDPAYPKNSIEAEPPAGGNERIQGLPQIPHDFMDGQLAFSQDNATLPTIFHLKQQEDYPDEESASCNYRFVERKCIFV